MQIIADLYAKLVALVEAADQHLIDPRTDPAKQDTYRNCEQDFLNTYSRSEIYFPLELCDALSSFASKLHHSNMEKFIFQASQPLSPADCDEWSSRLKARYRLVTEEVPCLKRKLTDEFRHLLGVNSPDNARA